MSPSLIFLMIALQQMLLTAVWALVWWRRVQPHGSVEFLLCSAMLTGSMVLFAIRADVAPWLGVGVAHLGIIAATFALRRGLQRFAGLPITPRLDAVVVMVALVGVMATLDPSSIRARILVLEFVEVGAMMHAGWIVLRHLRSELGERAAAWASLPFWTIALMHLARLLGAVFAPGLVARAADEEGFGNLIFAVVLMNAILVMNLSGLALIAMRIIGRLNDLSRRDALTGLLNRRAIEDDMDDRILAARRRNVSLAVLALDVDRFKQINDEHGHPAGDAVLVALAKSLQASARECDLVARAGGEEFWILAPDTDQTGAYALAERIREDVQRLVTDTGRTRLQVTASIGVALYEGTIESSHDLVRRADLALYEAKAQGRNRVVLAAPVPALATPASTPLPSSIVSAEGDARSPSTPQVQTTV